VLIETTLPHLNLAISTYHIISSAECSSNLARYDGVRYGYRCSQPKDWHDLYFRSRSEGFGDEVKRRIMTGTYVLSSGFYEDFYLKAQKVRNLIKQNFDSVLKEVDVIISPTTSTPAFKIGEKVSDPVNMYLSDMYTAPVSLCGLPAISIPTGFIKELPIGMQLIGNYFGEDRLLNVAHQYQLSTDWHKKMPACCYE
jgi:aspartyl-tRNA(Asn)/glutamyl-tRNA(Gln) amidotransferase subunit A